jgi:ribA/ribD-fused uncharacterized protein
MNKHWEYEDENVILFFGGIFSNWYIAPIVLASVKYNCVEQFMMYEKAVYFKDYQIAQRIMHTYNPGNQKKLGRQVQNFNADKWIKDCKKIVYPAILAKFTQHEKLKEILLSTGDKNIAEASPYDKIWGIGLSTNDPLARNPSNWNGKNFLGHLIMKAREELSE